MILSEKKYFLKHLTLNAPRGIIIVTIKKGGKKMERILSNAFSLQMLGDKESATLKVLEISRNFVSAQLAKGFISAVGHADTAAVISSTLGVDVEMNRVNVTLTENTDLYVAQITGGRLPEGCVTLPEGITIKFYLVKYL